MNRYLVGIPRGRRGFVVRGLIDAPDALTATQRAHEYFGARCSCMPWEAATARQQELARRFQPRARHTEAA